MFRQVKFALNQEYAIYSAKEEGDIAVEIRKNDSVIGKARITTDHVDVSCITLLQLDDNEVNVKLNDHTLGDIFFKFLIKFPSIVRKPEFRFILDTPPNLQDVIAKYHFDRGDDSNLKNEILIRRDKTLPDARQKPEGIRFQEAIDEAELPQLLSFLKKNAYWQSHLTMDRLKLLIAHSKCFFAIGENNEIVGFARVLTDSHAFASLWDVVVAEHLRGKNIGMSLMFNVFTHETLKNINNWLLFTDTAKGLYQKFGFVTADEIPNRKLVQKLRLQEAHPSYMSSLMEAVAKGEKIYLGANETFNFLFGAQGKRANLPSFLQEIGKKEIGTSSSFLIGNAPRF